MMSLYFFFDLDGTLFHTDELNNASYNYALKSVGIQQIEGETRITRDTIARRYPFISSANMQHIVETKQDFFCRHAEEAVVNEPVATMLRHLGSRRCVLWTSSDEARARCLLRVHGFTDCFLCTLRSDKRDVQKSLSAACDCLSCERGEIVVVENDVRVAAAVNAFGAACFLFVSS